MKAAILACLVCGVDSGPIRLFLFTFIGSLVLGSIALLTWGKLTGRFRSENEADFMALEAEQREEVPYGK